MVLRWVKRLMTSDGDLVFTIFYPLPFPLYPLPFPLLFPRPLLSLFLTLTCFILLIGLFSLLTYDIPLGLVAGGCGPVSAGMGDGKWEIFDIGL